MASIPKKVADRFAKTIGTFQKILATAKNRDVNEADTVAIIQDMLCEIFGYDKYLEVTSEFCVRGTYCDLAIKIDDKVHFLIEVKAIGLSLKENHLRQALQYGANHGVSWVVLTNGMVWELYRIRFEQPVTADLVAQYDFSQLTARKQDDIERLYLLTKEGLEKSVRDSYYERVQSVNRYIIASILLSDDVLGIVRREVKRVAPGVKIETDEIGAIIREEVLKRDVIESEEMKKATARVSKASKKALRQVKKRASEAIAHGEERPAAETSSDD